MTEFSMLGLSPTTLKAVADTGYTTATPIQASAIPVALAGRGPALEPVALATAFGLGFLLTLSRFCVVRGKTIDRAYLYFEVAERYALTGSKDG